MLSYAKEHESKMLGEEIRVELDTRAEKIGQKIRTAQLEQIPYMIIIGKKEQEKGVVSVRERRKGDLGQFSLADFLAMIKEESFKKDKG
jgi:threonyl-tRNA synthetase